MQHFAELRLPNLLKRWSFKTLHPDVPKNYIGGKMRGAQKWKKLAEQWPLMEEELCALEDANPEWYRSQPHYEAREAFRAAKARGEIVWPTWWELAGASARVNWEMQQFVKAHKKALK